jgi:adhesin transport system outer membrane protein
VFTRSNPTDRVRQALALGCLALTLTMPALAEQSAGLQTLGDVVRQALLENPDVAEARNQWLARREEVRQAEGGYYPTIDLNAGIGVEYTDSPGTRARYDGSNELTRKELGLNLRQMLFDGWGTRSEVSRQQARTDSAAARLVAVSQSTSMRATEAYVDLGRYEALYEISADSLAIHRRIQDQIRLRSDAGVGRRADLDQVNSRVALAEVNLVAADVNRIDARTTFQRVVGIPPNGNGYAPAPGPGAALAGSLAESLARAQANNPVLEVAAADIEAARAQHEAARQFDYPRLDLEVGGNLDDDLDGIEGDVDGLSAMLRLRYNLYRGGSDAARKRATAININEAMDVRDRSVRQLEESVRLAWAAMNATSAQLPLLRRQVDAAIATRDAYAKQFNIGQRTLLDLLNAENEVSQARQSVVNAEADLLLAQYRLLEAQGQLVDYLDLADAVVRDPAAG